MLSHVRNDKSVQLKKKKKIYILKKPDQNIILNEHMEQVKQSVLNIK